MNVEWPSFFDSENFTPLKHFLKYFGGTRIDIPPTCGTVTPNCLNPVSEDPETCAWKNIGTWDGTYPVYHVGNGDVVLVRSDGIYGTWSHELGNDPNGAVNVLGSFAEFVQYVATETGVV